MKDKDLQAEKNKASENRINTIENVVKVNSSSTSNEKTREEKLFDAKRDAKEAIEQVLSEKIEEISKSNVSKEEKVKAIEEIKIIANESIDKIDEATTLGDIAKIKEIGVSKIKNFEVVKVTSKKESFDKSKEENSKIKEKEEHGNTKKYGIFNNIWTYIIFSLAIVALVLFRKIRSFIKIK